MRWQRRLLLWCERLLLAVCYECVEGVEGVGRGVGRDGRVLVGGGDAVA